MSDNLKHLDDQNFDQEVSNGITLVDFYADWCGPCRMMEPVIHDLATEMDGKASIAKIDIEKSQKVPASYNVTSIPTLILFKDGQEVNRVVGVKDLDTLKDLINSAL